MNESQIPGDANASSSAESQSMIPCHIIISHPDKPKFLVIRHAGDHWSPPMLQVPSQGALMYKPATINRGMMKKYKLRTTVLRCVMEASNYALFELEMHASSSQKMQAVWVGLEEYAQFRQLKDGQPDPFEAWLRERASGVIPKLRAPWQKPGWYRTAQKWFDARVMDAGIQATGSTQQHKAGWPAACLLRVASAEGQIYFKASYDKPPGEARITEALAERWPDHVPAPLAVDESRNWMVMRDFKIRSENRPSVEHLAEFSETLGRIQLESIQEIDDWRGLDCPDMSLDFLCNRDGRADSLFAKIAPLLTSGLQPLDEGQMKELESAIEEARRQCDELAGLGIPDALSHLDYRPDNFFVEDGRIRIIDWADVAITHPFMAMCRTLDFLDHYSNELVSLDGVDSITEETRNGMRDAYLSCFREFADPAKLLEAFETARSVFRLFYFYYVAGQIQWIEPGTPHGNLLHFLLCSRARMLIREAAR